MTRFISSLVALLTASGVACAQPMSTSSNPPRLLYATGLSAGNTATTSEETIQSYAMAASRLAVVGDRIVIRAGGVLAATTDNKTVRIKLGATTIVTITTASATNVRWASEVWVLKTGASAQSYVVVSTVTASGAGTTSGTATETDTNSLTIAVTSQNATNSAAGSITCQMLTVDFHPANS